MRVSDTERQRVIDELRRHCAAGRLDVDEFADRIERAHGATTLVDLDQILGDLPMLRIADPARGDGALAAGRAGTGPGAAFFGRLPPPVGRLGASIMVLMSVAVVLATVMLVVLGSWAWAAVLVAGWLVGLLQGAIARRRPRSG